jgi:hypothetical protein
MENIEQYHCDASAVLNNGHWDFATPGGEEGAVVGRADGDGVDYAVLHEMFARGAVMPVCARVEKGSGPAGDDAGLLNLREVGRNIRGAEGK